MSWGYWGIVLGLVAMVADFFVCLSLFYSNTKGSPKAQSGKIDEPALGLGHHLLGHDEDVARLELRVCAQQLSQVVARPHLRQALDADQLEGFHTARLRRARSEGSSRSSANGSE